MGVIVGFAFATTNFKKILRSFFSPSLINTNTSDKGVISNVGDKMVNFVVKSDDKKEPDPKEWGASI